MQMHDARHIRALLSCPADHTAGKLYPRIPGGLGVKIIRITMEDDRPADDLLHTEAPGHHLHIRCSGIPQQRRQIALVSRMRFLAGVKMPAGIRKVSSLAASTLVDVKGEKSGLRPGKPPHLRFHYNAIAALVEFHHAPQRWVLASSAEPGNCIRPFLLFHPITPVPSYAARGESVSYSAISAAAMANRVSGVSCAPMSMME